MLEIVLNGNRKEFAPGEYIEGAVRWGGGPPPDGLVVTLFHRTEGRGTRDTVRVEEVDVRTANQMDEHGFRFPVPAAPYTFNGTLISLQWFIDASVGRDSIETPITISPWVETLRLQEMKEPSPLERLKQAKEQQQQQQQ